MTPTAFRAVEFRADPLMYVYDRLSAIEASLLDCDELHRFAVFPARLLTRELLDTIKPTLGRESE